MYMIVKNLPKSINIDALADGLQPLLKGGLFHKKGQIKAIKMIALVNKERRIIERHALVRLCSESARLRLIKAFNGSEYKKLLQIGDDSSNCPKELTASNYVVRSWRNDRRKSSEVESRKKNHRHLERRRLDLLVYPLLEKTF